MKNMIYIPAFLLCLSALLVFEQCGSSEEEAALNKAPTCSITNPANNAIVQLGITVSISVSASDADGSVASVKISIDDVDKVTLQAAPFSFDWNTTGVAPGNHTIKVTVTDNKGLSANTQIVVNVVANAPTVTTADITNIQGTTATSGGNVTEDGGIDVTARGVVWATVSSPSLSNKVGFTTDGSGKGIYTSTLTNLIPGTTYFVKAYATNSQGTAYGTEKTFTTTGLPILVTGDVSAITSNSAKCAGTVTDDGGQAITARGLVWSKTGNSTLSNNDGFTTETGTLGTFTGTMTTLNRYTNYFVRAYATNSNGTSYGDEKYFQTLPEKPAVTTRDVTDYGAYVGYTGGVVTDDGGVPIYSLALGVVWSTFPNPDINFNEGFTGTINQIQGNSFESALSALTPQTKYYVRAVAYWDINEVAYGEIKSFTTTAFNVNTGSFTDARDNTTYNTINFGGQTWMAENLAYLPQVCPSTTNCGYWVYGYQGSDLAAAKATPNYQTYGVLYNWTIAQQDVCPAGWHLPSSEEWSTLELNLGMVYDQAFGGSGPRGDQGGKMKETGTTHWLAPNEGATNVSGFTALPGGWKQSPENTFKNISETARFWTSFITGSGAIILWREMDYLNSAIANNNTSDPYEGPGASAKYGFSVRCVKD